MRTERSSPQGVLGVSESRDDQAKGHVRGGARARFNRAMPPLQDFMVVLCVVPVPGVVGSGPAWPELDPVGYYRTVGVRFAPDRLRPPLDSMAPDGVIRWDETELERVNPNKLDPSIQALDEPVDGEGVWYKSDRVFFFEVVMPHNNRHKLAARAGLGVDARLHLRAAA